MQKLKLIDEDNFVDKLGIDNGALDPPKSSIPQTRESCVDAHIVPFNELKGFIATDLCGQYPTMSNCSMKYIFGLFDYNNNTILSCPMKSNKGIVIIATYDLIHNKLTDAGIVPMDITVP